MQISAIYLPRLALAELHSATGFSTIKQASANSSFMEVARVIRTTLKQRQIVQTHARHHKQVNSAALLLL